MYQLAFAKLCYNKLPPISHWLTIFKIYFSAFPHDRSAANWLKFCQTLGSRLRQDLYLGLASLMAGGKKLCKNHIMAFETSAWKLYK